MFTSRCYRLEHAHVPVICLLVSLTIFRYDSVSQEQGCYLSMWDGCSCSEKDSIYSFAGMPNVTRLLDCSHIGLIVLSVQTVHSLCHPDNCGYLLLPDLMTSFKTAWILAQRRFNYVHCTIHDLIKDVLVKWSFFSAFCTSATADCIYCPGRMVQVVIACAMVQNMAMMDWLPELVRQHSSTLEEQLIIYSALHLRKYGLQQG